jgi:dihydroorotase
MRRALQYTKMFACPILNHPEVLELNQDGVMHEGLVSTVLGLSAMPAEAEDVMTGRDLRLAESTGGRLHLLNISSGGSVELIRRARNRGVAVTAGITAHHFALTDECLRTFDSNFKVNPPLRSSEHLQQCIAGLCDGTLDVICSGHAPRASEKKMRELDQAPFGINALETTLALVATYLVEPGHLTWLQAIEKLSTRPAQILQLAGKGELRPGFDADVTIIDPTCRWRVDPDEFLSLSRNTPLTGQELVGRAWRVIVKGETRFDRTAGGLLASTAIG